MGSALPSPARFGPAEHFGAIGATLVAKPASERERTATSEEAPNKKACQRYKHGPRAMHPRAGVLHWRRTQKQAAAARPFQED